MSGARGHVALLAVALASSLALYLGIAVLLGSVPSGWDSVVGFSLPSGPLFRALTRLPRLSLSPAGFSFALGGGLLALWLFWLLAVAVIVRLAPQSPRLARTIVLAGGLGILAEVVLLVPPTLSADLYRQASYGHMVARWGLNPYAVRACDVVGNPLLAFANQTEITTIYGPAYTWVSALAAAVVPPSPLATAVACKALSALALVGLAMVVAPVARRLDAAHGDGLSASLLLLWNPLLVLESAGSAHIEPLMMLLALVGLWCLLRGRAVVGMAFLGASVLTKWVTAPLLVLALLNEVARVPVGKRRRTLVVLTAVPVVTAAVLYAPFAPGLLSDGGIHALAVAGGAPLGNPVRAWLPQWAVGLGFAALVAVAARPAIRGGWSRLLAVATLLMLVLVVVVIPWLFPWYLVAPMAVAAVLPRDRRGLLVRLACFGLGAGVMLYYAKLVAIR